MRNITFFIPLVILIYGFIGYSIFLVIQILRRLVKALDVNEAWLMGYDVEMDRTPKTHPITPTASPLSPKEKELLHKYNQLDEKGQHTVSTVLDMEYNRCTNDYLMPIAAHNDNITDEEIELINQDLEDMANW